MEDELAENELGDSFQVGDSCEVGAGEAEQLDCGFLRLAF